MSIAPGLCSITFRALPADDVLDLAVRAGAEGVEWGADGHAPPGGGTGVEGLARRCVDAGVAVVSYGSYLGFGAADREDPGAVDAVLDTAEALGAPLVRIWAELGVGPTASDADRARVTARTGAYVDAATRRGLRVALEFHPYTLSETAASANRLLDDLDARGADVRCHWQPDPALSPADAVAELEAVRDRLAHLHVFSWGPTGVGDRRALADGADLWTRALAVADSAGPPAGGRRFALCEYVRGDDPEQFVADVATLRSWLTPGT